ncbi:MAG: cobalamin B12-binding domain-containing protein [Desulfobacteria bacterium]
MQEPRIRILLAKPGADCHDRGAHVLVQAFKDAGMEVIYTGLYQTPKMITETAIQEDVDIVALSCLSDSSAILFTEVMRLLKEGGGDGICVIGGGTIREEDRPFLEEEGVTGNYGPGTPLKVIVDHIVERVHNERCKKTQQGGLR